MVENEGRESNSLTADAKLFDLVSHYSNNSYDEVSVHRRNLTAIDQSGLEKWVSCDINP